MSRAATIGFVAAIVMLVTPAHSQQPSRTCNLLQVGEMESALGGKAKTKPSGSSQNVPGMAVDTCSVSLAMPNKGVRNVTISILANLPADAGELIRRRNAGTAREVQWKKPGARLEEKNVGNAICIMRGRPGIAGQSTCSIPRGKGYVEVDVTDSGVDLVPMDVVGALVQKAASRL